ncbi:MAG: SufD family Fe-S cluster assembly protein [Puniceicoccales bacterium]|jgi:Fe-S cluster assembly scaffold protein SufB|nr:SufD family Fe-S cluster assembly protein [Puniceicoccales bacterium]
MMAMPFFDELKNLCLTNSFDWKGWKTSKNSGPWVFFRNFMPHLPEDVSGDDIYAMALKHCMAEGHREFVGLGDGDVYEIPSENFGMVEINVDRDTNVRLEHKFNRKKSACGFFFVVVEDGASVVYNHNTDNEIGPDTFESIGFFLGEGSQVELTKNVIANANFRTEINFFLVGENAKANGKISYVGESGFFDCRVLQYHLGRNTMSNLTVKFALKENANSSFYGKITAMEKALDSEARQLHRNLILSDSARTTSVPSMDVRNNSIKCYHGSTVSEINPEQLFYLNARGVERRRAEQMIIDGFLKFY